MITMYNLNETSTLNDPMIKNLDAEIKSRQSILKELQSQVTLAEEESAQKIADAKKRTERKMEELTEMLKPLEAKRHLIAQVDAQLIQRRQAMEEETARLKAVRHQDLMTIRTQVERESKRLNEFQGAIALCKATVERL